jgi:competence protein ComEC
MELQQDMGFEIDAKVAYMPEEGSQPAFPGTLSSGNVFYAALSGFLAGVGGGLFFRHPSLAWILLALAASVVGVWRLERRGLACAAAMLAAAFGVFWSGAALDRWSGVEWKEYAAEGEAYVAREPETGERFQKAVLRFDRCGGEGCPSVLVLGFLSPHEPLHYGERISVGCDLKTPKNTDTGFDYRMFLAKDGIGYVCYPRQWRKVGDGDGFLSSLFAMRRKLEGSLEQVVPNPEAALGEGLLFGGDSRLTQGLQDRFARTGMSHIVAVSGSNVALVIQCLAIGSVWLGLRRQQAWWVALAGIGAFVIMVGASASAVRAGVMGGLTLAALQGGRLSSGTRAILFAAALMLLWNPLLLRYDMGFQLSFAATLGILLALSLLRERLGSSMRMMRELVVMTVAAELFVLPIALYHFHFVSTVSLLANVLILPSIPWAMLFAFLTALTDLAFPALAWVPGWMAYGLLHYILLVVETLGGWKWAGAEVRGFGLGGVALWYGALAGIFLGVRYRRRTARMRKESIV